MGGQHLLPKGGHWTPDRPARKIQLKSAANCQTSSWLVLMVGGGAGCKRKVVGGRQEGGNGTFPHLHCGGNVTACICQNSLNCTLKIEESLIYVKLPLNKASLVAQMVKRLPAARETRVRFLGWEDPLEKEMATHSSTLAWKIPWTERFLRAW